MSTGGNTNRGVGVGGGAAVAAVKSLSLRLYRCESGDEDFEVDIANGRTIRRRQFRISLFGTTIKGSTVCLRVTDVRPFFHVHLALPLTRGRFDAFLAWLRDEVCPPSYYERQQGNTKKRDHRDDDESVVCKKKLTGGAAVGDTRLTAIIEQFFIEETYAGEGMRDCIRLEFATDQLRKKALKFLRSPDTTPPFMLRQSSCRRTTGRPPSEQQEEEEQQQERLEEKGAHAARRLRCYETYGGKMAPLHAFLHSNQLQPTGWVTVRLETPRVQDEDAKWSSGCQAEYEVSSAHLTGNSGRLDPAPLLASSFDGEMCSSHSGDFPIPVKDYNKPATQIVEMCARHVHGVTVEAATAFLRQALEHMFPAEAEVAVGDGGDRAAPPLPIDCVYPKQSPFRAADPSARASWIDAMVALLAGQPLAKLLAMSFGKMREVVQTLRIAAVYEKQRLAAVRRAEAEAAAEEAAGEEGADDAEGGDGDNAASGEANQEAVELFAALNLDEGGGEGGGGGGKGKTVSPIDELLQKTDLQVKTNTFVDVLRAHLDTDAAAKAFVANAKEQQHHASAPFAANDAAANRRAASGAPPILTQQHKTQLLNQLFTLCLPPLEGDPVTFIGTVFKLMQCGADAAAASIENHIVATGQCAPIPGVVVHSMIDERALILKWAEIMRTKRPHIIFSYNGFGFDNKYLFLRARENGIADEVFAFSRQRDGNGLVRDWRTDTEDLAISQCRLASGDYSMERPHLPGVIQIDLLFYFRREHTGYISYSLDSVAMANLNDSVKAMDTVAVADLLGGTNACDGSPVLLDWNDPLTVRPRGDGQRLLRLETGNLAGLYVGNFICLQLMDGRLSANFLTQTAWRETANEVATTATATASSDDPHPSRDARRKIQVLGIQKSADGKRQCLLVDAAVADAARHQIASEVAERARLLGEVVPASDDVAMEKAPPAFDDAAAAAAAPVAKIGAGLRWCLVKDDVPHTEIGRLSKGSADDRAVVGKYCVGDCSLPLVLADKLGVLAWYLETASLCSVDVSTLVFNGQGVKLQSYVAKACFANRTLLRDLEKEVVAYDAATVLEPRKAAYVDEPVPVCDFSSLYPSIMAGYNLSPGTRCWAIHYRLGDVPGPKKGGPNLAYLDGGGLGAPFAYEGVLRADRRPGESPFLFHGLPGREYLYTWYTLKTRIPSPHGGKDKVINVGNKMVCWFAPNFGDSTHSAESHPQQAGIYPQQALGLLSARQAKKNLQKQEGLDPFVKAVYKLQEMVVKCANNSVYGQLGSATSALRDLDVAASICSIGRLHIMYTKTLVERLYTNRVIRVAPFGAMRTRSCYVYGDTDSVFFCFNLETLNPAEHADAFVPTSSSSSSSNAAAAPWSGPRPIRGRVALQCAIVLATKVAKLVSDTGPRPMGLAYEKTMMKFFIVSKKKYAGILHVYDPDKGELKFMGLQVKKRDSCDCVRDVFGTVMSRMLHDASDVTTMVRYVTAVVQTILEGKLTPSKFLITKTLKSNYSRPLTVPHNVLADRIEQRAPGTRPKPGDRVTYAFVVPAKGTVGLGTGGKLVMGQRIDTLAQIQSAGLQIDFETYVVKHIIQPVVQLLSLLVEAIVRELGTLQDKAELAEVMITVEPYTDTDLVRFNKIMKVASKRLVDRIIFGPFLRELSNKSRGLQDITGFFGGGGGGQSSSEAAAPSSVPQLGPLIHRVPKPVGVGGPTLTPTVSAGKLQTTMKSFFKLGGSR